MRDEKKAVEEMYSDETLRTDIFSIKQVTKVTGLSRAMLIKLEDMGFLVPKHVNQKTGYRYYDTFNIFKLLQYKRLRIMGLSQNEIFDFYSRGLESTEEVVAEMKHRRQLIDQTIELLTLRYDRRQNYSFSFYDFKERACLVAEGDFSDPMQITPVAYNLSVEAIARGLKPSATEDIMSIRYDSESKKYGDSKNPYHVKICQPIDPDIPSDVDQDGIEVIPAAHTFSMLIYGIDHMNEALEHFYSELKERGLKPTGAPMRMQGIIAQYTAMHMDTDEFVLRMALPIEE